MPLLPTSLVNVSAGNGTQGKLPLKRRQTQPVSQAVVELEDDDDLGCGGQRSLPPDSDSRDTVARRASTRDDLASSIFFLVYFKNDDRYTVIRMDDLSWPSHMTTAMKLQLQKRDKVKLGKHTATMLLHGNYFLAVVE